MNNSITLQNFITRQNDQYHQKTRNPESLKNSATKGAEILQQITKLSSPNNLTTIQEPANHRKTNTEILDKLANQLKPTFDYLDLLAQNISHYINEKKVKSESIQELLKGVVPLERFFKRKLIETSEEINHPLIAGLLRLTAHDLNLFSNFSRISTIFLDPKIKNKHQACESIWKGTSELKGIQASLLEQKKLISSVFERVEKISKNNIGIGQEISHKDFLKNLGKLFDQVQIDNWQLAPSITTRLTLNNQAITRSTNETRNPFDQTFTEEVFPIKFDPILLNTILRNIIINAIDNSPTDSQLNLEINIVKKIDTDKKQSYLHIKLSNPLADPAGFTKKNILKDLKTGKKTSTKKDPTETNGTFLQTLNNLMQKNGGLLKISTTTKDQNLENSDFKIKIPLTAVPELKDLYKSFMLDENTIQLEGITKDYSHKLVNIKDLIIKANQSTSTIKKNLMNQFLNKHSNVSLGKKSSQTLKTLEFNLELKYPLEKSSGI
ncbi:MAG: hypothetical protein EBR67_08435 [Proteobacteria bacterium]|nr:hypothetical protein [Pseudomonadota bacterium]